MEKEEITPRSKLSLVAGIIFMISSFFAIPTLPIVGFIFPFFGIIFGLLLIKGDKSAKWIVLIVSLAEIGLFLFVNMEFSEMFFNILIIVSAIVTFVLLIMDIKQSR